jgi:hypothetical protein
VIPFVNSVELVANCGLPSETLVEVGQDHRLADPETLKKRRVIGWEVTMTERQKRQSWLLLIPAALAVAALVGVLVLQFRAGVQVTVENTGTTSSKAVVLHVTGASYELGDIAPGESAAARVSPTGESSLDIEFTDADGKIQRLKAGGYFESGYRGSIRVEIKDGQIDKFEDNTKLW